MQFDAVIFDLDGTLIDTEALAWTAGQAAFAEHGVALDEGLFIDLVGKDHATGANVIRARYGDIDVDAIDRTWRAMTVDLYAGGIAFKTGALEAISAVDSAGLTKAIATSSQDYEAVLKLSKTGLDAHFDIVVTYQDVARAKPAPDPYLLAAQHLGVAPARALAFEDSETGAEAAFAAGLTVVQVPDVVPSGHRFAHYVAPSLMDGLKWAKVIG